MRVVALSFLSFIATDERHLEEAESRARAAQVLVEGLHLMGFPKPVWRPSHSDVLSQKTGDSRKPRRSWRAVFLRDEGCPA